ncbi:MAG: hypothetical protein IJ404_07795 [Clostridia bacterium]|nr:hypothetical protein [Clostridia bacterium]
MNNRLWQKEYYLRASDFDKFSKIKLSSVLDLFQDAAGQHAEALGVGFEAMLAHSYLWVLVRIKLQIISQPERYQKVLVKTWPLAPHRLNYRREYCIENEAGEKLIVGSSEWVIINSEKRTLVSDPDLYPFVDNFYPEMNFEPRLMRVRDFDPTDGAYTVTPGFCELDVNNHVNNTKYANYVIDALSPDGDFDVDLFQIDFRKEVVRGSKLSVYHKSEGDLILAKGQNESGETMFVCSIKCK